MITKFVPECFKLVLKQFLLVWVLWVVALNVNAQKLSFSHLTVKEGLSRNSVLGIAQDNFGFMWFATGHGLNRYDGNRFNTYIYNSADTNSLSDNYINTLLFDSKQKLWVGTEGGLNSYEPLANNFKRIKLSRDKDPTQPGDICIYEDKKKNLWIGTTQGLFLRKNGASQFVKCNKLGMDSWFTGNEILCVYEDRFGFLWIATAKGLVKSRFDRSFRDVETFIHNPNQPESISDSPIRSILEDAEGEIWMASESRGLNLFNRNTKAFVHYQQQLGNPNSLIDNSIRRMMADAHGNILIGTRDGLSVFNPVNRSFTSYVNEGDHPKSLSQNSICSFYKDRDNNIWIGTYYGGVNVVYGTQTSFKAITQKKNNLGVNHNAIRSILPDASGNLWIGTNGGGLNYFNKQTKRFSYYTNRPDDPTSISSNLIKTVYIDKDGHTWIGISSGGLDLYDSSNGTFKHFFEGKSVFEAKRTSVLSILEDSQDRFWIGGPGINGVYHRKDTQLYPIKNHPLMEGVKKEYIIQFFEDRAGNLWGVTQFALYTLSKNSQVVTKTAIHDNYGGKRGFNWAMEDHLGNIWMGLYYGGVYCYDPVTKKIVKRYTTKQGLCNDNVVGILEDNQYNIWISTINGLSKLNPRQGTIQNYTVADGVVSEEFNANALYKSPGGELFFGGMNGITHFLPQEIERNNNRASLVFTGLKLFNREVVPAVDQAILPRNIIYKPKLIFSSRQNIFTLEFSLLNFIKPGKNRYAYKLQGINADWNESSLAEATYTNLPPGNYVFSVKGANNDGVWSEVENIHITILPPIWRTWWAYLGYILAIAGIVFFIVRFFYLQQLIKRDEELHLIKLNFFTNISHEIRSHLSLIMIPLERVIDEHKDDGPVRGRLTNLKRNADRLFALVTELMDFRKAESKNLKLSLEKDDLVGFLNDIYDSFREVCEKKSLTFTFLHPEEPIIANFDKGQFGKVIFNLLSNAYKYTPNGGDIVLEVAVRNTEVIISVSDTGPGISPIYFDKLFTNYFQVDDAMQNTGYGIGLALSKHIVELHKGRILVDSKTGFTKFTVSLPFQKNIEDKKLRPITIRPIEVGTQIVANESNNEVVQVDAENKKYTVLIADDNDELREMIKDLLCKEYTILECTDGLAALQLAITEIPDLIISDVMMPNMNGFDFCAKVKTDERTSHIPVILLTAKDTQSDQISGLNTGAELYLTKPFSVKVLQLSVRNIMTSRDKISQKYRKEFIFAPSNTLLNTLDEQFLSKLIKVIEEGMEDKEFGVDLLAGRMNMSQTVLYKKVKALTAMTVNDFSKSIRLKRAAQLLKESGYNVSEVSEMVGFVDFRYFTKEFKKQFKQTPREYLNS